MASTVSVRLGSNNGSSTQNCVTINFSVNGNAAFTNLTFDDIINNDPLIASSILGVAGATGYSVGQIEGMISNALSNGGRQSLANQFVEDVEIGLGSGVVSGGYYDGGDGGDYGGGGGGEFGDGGGYYAETDARGRKLGAANRAEIGAPKHETLGHSTEAGLHHVPAIAAATVAGLAGAHSALDLAFTDHHGIRIGQPALVAIPDASITENAVRLASLQLTQTLAQHAAPSAAGTVIAPHEEHHTGLQLAAHS